MSDAVDDRPDWQRRVVGRSLHDARQRSIDRGANLVRAAAKVLERSDGESLTVQDVADEAGQSLRTLYQYFESKDDLLLAVFEEAMRTYAQILRAAIDHLDDPLERLAGALIASVRMPALHDKAGVDRGLSHLRLQLGQADPALVARSQEPVTALYRELVVAAFEVTPSAVVGAEAATYFLSSVRTSFILSTTLGNEFAVDLPDVIGFSSFCLGGLGIAHPRAWHEDVDERLELAKGDGRSILRRLAKGIGAVPMTPVVLVHGGGLDRRCWDRLLPHLVGPAIAVDLPGRGTRPVPLESVGIAACAEAIREDVDAAGFDDIVLVGHSLAGCSMPATIGLLGDRVRHAVFVAATVPADGQACIDTLDPEIQALARGAQGGEPQAMDPALAKLVLGEDLDEEQFAWCVERLVPEAPGLTLEPVDLAPLRSGVPCTWIRTLQDIIVPADKQLRFVEHVGGCTVVDLDAGHMCMVSRPERTAAILGDIAG